MLSSMAPTKSPQSPEAAGRLASYFLCAAFSRGSTESKPGKSFNPATKRTGASGAIAMPTAEPEEEVGAGEVRSDQLAWPAFDCATPSAPPCAGVKVDI